MAVALESRAGAMPDSMTAMANPISAGSPSLFVVAASSAFAQRNATRAVVKGMAVAAIADTLKTLIPGPLPLNAEGRVSVWGINPNLKHYWLRLRDGDWVLFYQRGFISIAGRVAYTVDSEALAALVWGPGNAASLSLSLILKDVTHTWAPVWALRDELGGRFLGFRRVSDDRLSVVAERHGTVDDFVTHKILSHPAPAKPRGPRG